MRRRDLLCTLGGSGLGLSAGCLDEQQLPDPPHNGSDTGVTDDVEGLIRPDDDPDPVTASLDCTDDEFSRIKAKYDHDGVYWGDAEIFALRVSEIAYEYGDTLSLTLTNTSRSEEEINDYRWFNFEIYTADGWQDVRGDTNPDDSRIYADDGGGHERGEEWHWEIELTETGIETASFSSDRTRVCPELQSGRHRFVFANQFGAEKAIAVAFDLSV